MFHENTGEEASRSFLTQNVVQRSALTLDELALREGISILDLPNQLRKAATVFSTYAQHEYNLEDDILPSVDFIYQCWQASRSLPSGHALEQFAHTLDSFDTFLATYASASSFVTQVNLAQLFDRFIYKIVHNQKIMTVSNPSARSRNTFGVYSTQGEWVELPGYLLSQNVRDYVGTEILTEVIALRNTKQEDEIYHSTGSSSLPGIASQHALLSSALATERGEEPKVGEYITQSVSPYYLESGSRRLLCDIHASKKPETGYALARWFDEFHVTFGISIARQQAYLASQNSPHSLDTIELADISGEGIRLGSTVPLNVVTTIYVDFAHKSRVIAWAKVNCPSASVISYEAFEVMKRERVFPNYSQPRFTTEQLLQLSPTELS